MKGCPTTTVESHATGIVPFPWPWPSSSLRDPNGIWHESHHCDCHHDSHEDRETPSQVDLLGVTTERVGVSGRFVVRHVLNVLQTGRDLQPPDEQTVLTGDVTGVDHFHGFCPGDPVLLWVDEIHVSIF